MQRNNSRQWLCSLGPIKLGGGARDRRCGMAIKDAQTTGLKEARAPGRAERGAHMAAPRCGVRRGGTQEGEGAGCASVRSPSRRQHHTPACEPAAPRRPSRAPRRGHSSCPGAVHTKAGRAQAPGPGSGHRIQTPRPGLCTTEQIITRNPLGLPLPRGLARGQGGLGTTAGRGAAGFQGARASERLAPCF